jgi:hypothetical protein
MRWRKGAPAQAQGIKEASLQLSWLILQRPMQQEGAGENSAGCQSYYH